MDERVDAVDHTRHGHCVNRRPPPARQDSPARGLLRRQRDLPLPRAGLRRPALRSRRRARRGLAAHRVGRRDLRAVAATVAAPAPPGRRPAAAIFALWRRRCRSLRHGADVRLLLAWGTVLAVMNSTFYLAIDRLPLGTVAAIEFLPVVVLAVLGARTARNVAALALAVAGVYLLTDVALDGDPLGVAFAFVNAALFAGYIIVSHRAAQNGSVPGIDLLGMAMLIAAVGATPIGAWAAVPAFGDPVAIAAGIGVGVSSSVIPYVTDQLAMARMSRSTYALMVSLLPATATVIGIVVLAQLPSAVEAAGVALVIVGVGVHRDADAD